MAEKDKVTLEDIAQKTGVSVPTVSQALSGKGRISHATQERILTVVEELILPPRPSRPILARRRADAVATPTLQAHPAENP